MESIVAKLDMAEASQHYLSRQSAHTTLRQMFVDGAVQKFVQLALGISNPAGNYSAAEHGLGPRILSESSEQDVFDLASEIEACSSTHHLPELIYRHKIPCLKISVGSEIAMMMMKPDTHWVGNVRTIWSHLLIKHNWQRTRANEELALYREGERDSEMDYLIWRDVYLAMEQNILALGRMASEAAIAQDVTPGSIRFMWPDAVASMLFDQFAKR